VPDLVAETGNVKTGEILTLKPVGLQAATPPSGRDRTLLEKKDLVAGLAQAVSNGDTTSTGANDDIIPSIVLTNRDALRGRGIIGGVFRLLRLSFFRFALCGLLGGSSLCRRLRRLLLLLLCRGLGSSRLGGGGRLGVLRAGYRPIDVGRGLGGTTIPPGPIRPVEVILVVIVVITAEAPIPVWLVIVAIIPLRWAWPERAPLRLGSGSALLSRLSGGGDASTLIGESARSWERVVSDPHFHGSDDVSGSLGETELTERSRRNGSGSDGSRKLHDALLK